MRHKGTSILVASQDPPSVPASLIELSSQIILHKFNSPTWLRHIQKANAALEGLTPAKLAALKRLGRSICVEQQSDRRFRHARRDQGALPPTDHPEHGGATKTGSGQRQGAQTALSCGNRQKSWLGRVCSCFVLNLSRRTWRQICRYQEKHLNRRGACTPGLYALRPMPQANRPDRSFRKPANDPVFVTAAD